MATEQQTGTEAGLRVCASAQGVEIGEEPVHLNRHRVVFELHNPLAIPRVSEVLPNLRLSLRGQTIYSGKALITNLMNTGQAVVCEAALEEACFQTEGLASLEPAANLPQRYRDFLQTWERTFKVVPEYKAAVADLHSFLTDLRVWLEQISVGLLTTPEAERLAREAELIQELAPETSQTITAFFDRFEEVARRVEPEQEPAYQSFGRRLVRPLLLGAPFVWRTLQKPLGYAGDYEMVNMMMRDPHEGNSLYAKAINFYALGLPPVVAHRNRIQYLEAKLRSEARRCLVRGQTIRILNLGCGPAWEVQRFLRDDDCAGTVQLTLMDFNEETLIHTRSALASIKPRSGRGPDIRLVRRSVQQILKQALKATPEAGGESYEFIYCAGLFDYLSDGICRSLVNHLYRMLTPEGLLLVTNVDDHPSRREMEYFLEWHLLYRNAAALRALVPPEAGREQAQVLQDPTGVNVFLEIRKPKSDQRPTG